MSFPIASAARAGNVEFVSWWDDDLDRPVQPEEPEPLDDEDPAAFEARAEAYLVAAKAYEKAARKFQRLHRVARETQEWSAVLKPNATPVIFVCKPIEYEAFTAFRGLRGRLEGEAEIGALLMRMSLVAIRGPGFDTFSVPAPTPHTLIDPDTSRPVRTRVGPVAPDSMIKDIVRRLPSGRLALAVVENIGAQILDHWMRAPVP